MSFQTWCIIITSILISCYIIAIMSWYLWHKTTHHVIKMSATAFSHNTYIIEMFTVHQCTPDINKNIRIIKSHQRILQHTELSQCIHLRLHSVCVTNGSNHISMSRYKSWHWDSVLTLPIIKIIKIIKCTIRLRDNTLRTLKTNVTNVTKEK